MVKLQSAVNRKHSFLILKYTCKVCTVPSQHSMSQKEVKSQIMGGYSTLCCYLTETIYLWKRLIDTVFQTVEEQALSTHRCVSRGSSPLPYATLELEGAAWEAAVVELLTRLSATQQLRAINPAMEVVWLINTRQRSPTYPLCLPPFL